MVCGGQNNAPPPRKDIHIVIPGTCVYVGLQGKGRMKVTDGSKMANQLALKSLFWILQVGPM